MASYLIFNQNGSGLGDTQKILVNRDHVKYVSYIAANQLALKLNSGSFITIQLTGNEAPAVIDNINEALKANPSGKELKVALPAGITIDPAGTTIAGGGGGEANTASNVGAGEGVFKQKTGIDLEFKSLVAGTNITLTSGADDITIDAAAGGGAASLNDLTDASTVKGGFNGGANTENLILGPAATNLPNLDTTNSFGNNIILQPSANGNPTNLTNGNRNVLIGHYNGVALTTGDGNIVIGNAALISSTDGTSTVAIGNNALQNNTKTMTTSNVAIGLQAAKASTTGEKITCIGANSGWSTTSAIATGSNITTIGYNAWCSSIGVSNEITLGNSSVTALRCAVTSITSLSDERDKKDITDLEYGLDFIESLQPKQFTWNNRPETMVEVDEDGNEIEKEIENANKGKKDFGFIAQEVQALDNDVLRLVYDENPDKLEMSYGKLVPILVKAVKELSDKVKTLEAK